MPRGIPWDDLPTPFNRYKDRNVIHEPPKVIKARDAENINVVEDVKEISKRVAFGLICGGLTGLVFGTVDVMRDAKKMAGNKQMGTGQILRTSSMFGGFFGMYHGARKIIALYAPVAPEYNVMAAAMVSIVPMLFIKPMRKMVPYGVVLIALDAFNGMDDV